MSIDEPSREADQILNVRLPECTQQLVGHKEEYERALHLVKNNKLPNAILLHGPRGIGKAVFAFSLTREILEITGQEQVNSIKQQICSVSHPNLFLLRKKKQENNKKFSAFIRIDDVLKMIFSIRQTAGVDAHKICIIDAIDDCNISAANALLKILEEPPNNTLFILISHKAQSLLPTIRSRCHSIALRNLNEIDIREILEQSEIELNEHKIELALELAKGSPRKAFEVTSLDGIDNLPDIQNWLNSKKIRENASHITLVNKILKQGETQEIFAKNILLDWIVKEAKACAKQPKIEKSQLRSIVKLWEYSQTLFVNAQTYNLDKKQTFISLFDALQDYFKQYINNKYKENYE